MKLAVLGPSGTFSENAADKYIDKIDYCLDKVFYQSIPHTFFATGNECELGIVPVENTLDGYVQRSLDLLLEQDLQIIDEIIVPVKFSLISNVKSIDEIKKVYVQFKAHGQCLKVLDSFKDVEIMTTQSNIQSLEDFKNDNSPSCAVIPSHMLEKTDNFYIEDITDSSNNFTKFFVITKNKVKHNFLPSREIKVSLYVIPKIDRAGILYEILENFYKNKLNLSSIISRPTKQNLGTYNFYIEISADYSDNEVVIQTLEELEKKYSIKVLGIYSV